MAIEYGDGSNSNAGRVVQVVTGQYRKENQTCS